MTTFADFFDQSQLSMAAYAKGLYKGIPPNAYIAALVQAGMSKAQAEAFSNRYAVDTQIEDSISLFSATVFIDTDDPAQTKYVAIRGTEPPNSISSVEEWLQDISNIGGDGIAVEQAFALFNWLQILYGAPNSTVVQYSYNPDTKVITPESATASGLLAGQASISVTGHSLGGHLAMIMSRLAPNLVSSVYTYNAPGFDPITISEDALTSDGFFAAITDFGVPLSTGPVGATWDSGLMWHFDIEGDVVHEVGTTPGVQNIIFTESASHDLLSTHISQHLKEPITDALAVYAIFGDIDPSLNTADPAVGIATITDILKAATNKPEMSLEISLDGLRVLFSDSSPTSIARTSTDDRNQFYTNLLDTAFRQRIAGYTGLLSVTKTTDKDVASLIDKANGSDALAYRYALRELNSFVITGDDGLYSPHNLSGELETYVSPQATPAGMTSFYIADRAAFLYWKNLANIADGFGQIDASASENWLQVDRKQNYFVRVFGGGTTPSSPERVAMFGADGADALQGGLLGDRLYGGAGTDLLRGGAGDDHLEGGLGVDLYQYNAGRSLGGAPSNDGSDEILDTDGKGFIRYTYTQTGLISDTVQSTNVGGLGIKVSDTQWQSVDGKFTYRKFFSGALGVSINGDAGGEITIDEFDFTSAQSTGYFGIRLVDAPETPVTARVINGDLEPLDVDPNTPGLQTGTDEFGNVLVGTTAAPDRADTLYGSDGQNGSDPSDSIVAGGGEDVIEAKSGDDIVQGGAGRDTIDAGSGNDLIEAGSDGVWNGDVGGDIVDAGDGNDEIYGDIKTTLAEAITQGELNNPSGQKGDFIYGGTGDDWLIGAAGNDVLDGGPGRDLIVGGAGDDTIDGDIPESANVLNWTETRSEILQDGRVVDFIATTTGLVDRSGETLDVNAGDADVIYGGSGNDWIYARGGDDYVDGGDGNDDIAGGAGSDILIGGLGDDVLLGDNGSQATSTDGDDYLDGGAGNDTLFGAGGNDILIGGEGSDYLDGGDGSDLLWGGPGTDTLKGGAGKDTYVFQRGDGREDVYDTSDVASVAEASVVVMGADIVRGQIKFRPGSLVIDAGGGDEIHFDGFNLDDPSSTPVLDQIQFADGSAMSYQDVLDQGFDIEGTEGDDVIEGTAVIDRIDAMGGNDTVIAKAGDDTILGGDGDDYIDAGAGNDVIDGGAGQDVIDAGEGNDTITTSGGGDIVYGGPGDDTVFAQNDDLIIDQEGANHLDLSAYSGLTSANLEVTQFEAPDGETYLNLHVRDDLSPGTTPATGGVSVQRGAIGSFVTVVVSDGQGGTVTLAYEQLMNQYAAQGFVYRDGDAADTLIGTPYADTFFGYAGADEIKAGAGDDRIDGGSGDDTLEGGAGNDTYLLAYNGGRDTVIEDGQAEPGSINTIQLDAGIASGQVVAEQQDNDLVVQLRATSDALVIKDFYLQPQSWQDAWQVRDAAGTAYALESFVPVAAPPPPDTWLADQEAAFKDRREQIYSANRLGEGFATIGDDTYQKVEHFFDYASHASSSTITVRQLVVNETTADDSAINVGAVFSSSPLGQQSANFDMGQPLVRGLDTVRAGVTAAFGTANGATGDDGEFIPAGSTFPGFSGGSVRVDPGDVAVPVYVPRVGSARSVMRNAGAADYANSGAFADPTQWILAGFRVYHAATTGGGNEVLGRVTSLDTSTTYDQKLTVTDFSAGASDNTITVYDASLVEAGDGDDTMSLRSGYFFVGPDWERSLGLESLFDPDADSAAQDRYWNAVTPSYMVTNFGQRENTLGAFVDAAAGDDTVNGSEGQDTIVGGDGNDALDGGAGSDRYLFTANETGIDTLADSGLSATTYLDWYYWSRGILNWDERAKHPDQYRLSFEGGVEYFDTLAQAQQQSYFQYASVAYLDPLPDVAPVLTRDDTATLGQLETAGVLARDVVEFGPGLALADVTLTITVPSASVEANPGRPWYDGGTLSVRWNGGLAGFDVAVPDVKYGFVGSNLLTDGAFDPYAEQDPSSWRGYRLGEGVEAFQFADGSTYTLEDLLQQATVFASLGDYHVGRDSGPQVITANYESIVFDDGIRASEVAISRDGRDLLFTVNNGPTALRVQDWYGTNGATPLTNAYFYFDGKVDAATLTETGLALHGTDGDDVLVGLDGYSNKLYGEWGNDVLQGGSGDDVLQGGYGADVFVLEANGGHDVIENPYFWIEPSSEDRIRVADGIAPQDVKITRNYNDVSIWVRGTTTRMDVTGWFSNGSRLGGMEFADGTFWDADAMEARFEPAPGTPQDDAIFGSEGDDVIDALGGNDEIYGNAGNDTLTGGEGDDYVEGGAGFDVIYGGAGADDLEDWEDGSYIDAGEGDDYTYDEGNAFVIGGPGDDWIDHHGDGGVIAFNPGDGNDTVYAAGAMTLSIGGGVQPADLSLSRDGTDLVIDAAGTDSIRLTRQWEADPAAWPAITLQMFGSVHEYDFNAVIADYKAQAAGDPNFVLLLEGVLQAHETATSATEALGGAIAWQYATTGSTAALSVDDLRAVLSDPNFGLAPQPITLAPTNSAPVLAVPISDQTANEDSVYSFTLPAGTFSDPDAGDTLAFSASLADGSALPGWLSFDAGTQTFFGTPLQADVGTIDLRVTATDGGGLSAGDSFTLNVANVNDAPVVSAADGELLLGDAVAAASLFSVADEDGDVPAQYEFWDDVSGGGHFSVNGVAQGAGVAIPVAAADLANTQYVAGATPGTERVWARAFDGQAWSAWKSWNMTSALHIPDAAPVTTPVAANQTVLLDATVAAATLFGVSDADGDPIAAYQFWDDVAGGGYFSVNGIAQSAGTAITVSSADLANAEYVGGSEAGAETVWVRATDGQTWGAWKSWTMRSWPHETNSAPIAAAQDAEVLHGDSVAVSTLFSVNDADGDAITKYEFWDDTAGGGYFSVGGVEQDNNPIPVNAAQLADVQYTGGADPGTEQVWVRAFDGLEWGAWKNWNMTTALHIPDAAPEVAPGATTQTVLLGQAVDATTLFAVSDADGDPIAGYEFLDSGDGGGYFSVNGVEQGVNVAIAVSATDLASTQFVGASTSTSDLIWARATDGQSWSPWISWTMNSWPHATNAAPVADASAGAVLQAEAVPVSSLFSVSDADADPVTQYEFWDDVNGGGSFRVNGIQQAAGQAIAVSAADLANTEYVGGANLGTEQVWVRASDGMQWGAWKGWSMTTALHLNDAAPVVTTSIRTALLGQAVDAASLFGVSDADGDPIASYEFFDSTAGGGRFTVNGIEQGVNVAIPVSAADLANTQFVASADIASDQLWVRATDGQSWGDWKSWTQNSWPHLADSAPVASAGSAGVLENEALPVSMFFATSDADGDPVAKYEFWDDVNGGGYFQVEGVQQAAGQAIPVSAADLANVDYVGGANPGTEQVWVRASDGMAWGAWKNWLMSTEGGALRGGSGPDTLNGDPSTPILEGGAGDDNLTAADVNSLLAGDAGNDTLAGGGGNDLLAGGSGDDTISTGAGDNVIAFNAGGGTDTVYSAAGAQNTLSFGGGITYDDLSLSKTGNDLIVNVGQNDKMILKDWYAGSNNVLNLQIILDATSQFDANSSDPLYNKKVETFDFLGMVNEFDQALEQSPGLTSWAMTNALLAFHLSGSDDAALGGDLAYWYGRNAGFAGVSVTAAQQVLGDAGFGADAQSLHPFDGLQEGYVKLS